MPIKTKLKVQYQGQFLYSGTQHKLENLMKFFRANRTLGNEPIQKQVTIINIIINNKYYCCDWKIEGQTDLVHCIMYPCIVSTAMVCPWITWTPKFLKSSDTQTNSGNKADRDVSMFHVESKEEMEFRIMETEHCRWCRVMQQCVSQFRPSSELSS